jgi:hypothetical protein
MQHWGSFNCFLFESALRQRGVELLLSVLSCVFVASTGCASYLEETSMINAAKMITQAQTPKI